MTRAALKAKRAAFAQAQAPAPPVDKIADHPDKCPCARCAGLEQCYRCGHWKVDGDWCIHCKALVC